MDITTLRHRLQQAPLDFFGASSLSALREFDSSWLSLRNDVESALQLSLLNDEDVSLVHSTATLLTVWGDSLLKIDNEADKITTTFMDEVESVFARLAITHTTPPSTFTHRRRSSGAHPPFIAPAYSWILQNVHDPYPSSQVKERISRDAGRPLRAITDWFKDVRRHIGWVTMCKDHFQGSRALAVQAANHVYRRDNSTSQPSLSSDIVFKFESIRMRLRDMFPVADDNGNSSDDTDDSFPPSSLSSRGYPSDQSSYARSRSSSSTPSLVFSTDDEDNHSLASFTLDDAPPASLGKRKSLTEESISRPLKRSRFGCVTDGVANEAVSASIMPLDPASPHISLIPSRKRCLSDAATEWEDATLLSSSTPCDSGPPLRLPKRRLSVSDSQPTPKRPCLPLAVGPRKQAVSTPVPIAHQTTSAVDEWFPFELPDTSLSVELFNWDVVVENDAFFYNSLFDNILQTDSQDPSTATPLSDAYQLPTSLLGVSSAVDPSVLDISSVFTKPSADQLTVPISNSPSPLTATTTPVFDFLDAFLSAVNDESPELHTTQSSSNPSTELSLNDSIDLFGESVVMP